MANIDSITQCATLHSAALATLGSDPTWDKALKAYLRADALQRADSEFGALDKASAAFRRSRWALEDMYGPNWSGVPKATAEHQPAFAAMQAAEDRWAQTFCQVLWRTSRELALTPAPTIAAAMFKATLIEIEDLSNDCDFPADPMEVLQADFARLAGEA